MILNTTNPYGFSSESLEMNFTVSYGTIAGIVSSNLLIYVSLVNPPHEYRAFGDSLSTA